MKKIFQFLFKSNRIWHLLGGFMVGIVTLDCGYAIYASMVAASCLELKDFLYHTEADLTDWLLTIGGGVLASCLILALKFYLP